MSTLLAMNGLSIGFGPSKIVQDLSLSVAPGEALGIVGESGSGKSLSMLALLQLLPAGASVSAGQAMFDGTDLLSLKRGVIADIRGRRIGIVFQDPLSALNPVLTIGRQIAEVVRRHFGGSRAAGGGGGAAERGRGGGRAPGRGLAGPGRRARSGGAAEAISA